MAYTSGEERLKVFKSDFKNTHVMKVENFSVLKEHQAVKCESSVFSIYGYRWKLVLYPRGKEGLKDHISLYVEIEDTDSLPANWVVNANLRLFLLVHREDRWRLAECHGVCFNSSNIMCGAENLISLNEFLDARWGLIENDNALFGAEVSNVQPCNTIQTRFSGTAECLAMIENPPNSKFTWKITKFSSFNQPQHFSHGFLVGQRKWRIEIYPKGQPLSLSKDRSMSVFLSAFEHLDDSAPKAKTYAEFYLRVLDQRYGEHREILCEGLFGASGQGFGLRDFLPLKDLYDGSKGFLMNDVVYIGVEFRVVSVVKYC